MGTPLATRAKRFPCLQRCSENWRTRPQTHYVLVEADTKLQDFIGLPCCIPHGSADVSDGNQAFTGFDRHTSLGGCIWDNWDHGLILCMGSMREQQSKYDKKATAYQLLLGSSDERAPHGACLVGLGPSASCEGSISHQAPQPQSSYLSTPPGEKRVIRGHIHQQTRGRRLQASLKRGQGLSQNGRQKGQPRKSNTCVKIRIVR